VHPADLELVTGLCQGNNNLVFYNIITVYSLECA